MRVGRWVPAVLREWRDQGVGPAVPPSVAAFASRGGNDDEERLLVVPHEKRPGASSPDSAHLYLYKNGEFEHYDTFKERKKITDEGNINFTYEKFNYINFINLTFFLFSFPFILCLDTSIHL